MELAPIEKVEGISKDDDFWAYPPRLPVPRDPYPSETQLLKTLFTIPPLPQKEVVLDRRKFLL